VLPLALLLVTEVGTDADGRELGVVLMESDPLEEGAWASIVD
jgi:hypothetical protein